jgi:DNA-binding CsgD family transcriptional regulator
MWQDVLSEDARHLYEDLITSGGRPVGAGFDGLTRDEPALLELVWRGLVWETAEPQPRVYGVAPAVAMRQLMVDERQSLISAHHRIIGHYAELERLERRYRPYGGVPDVSQDVQAVSGAEAIAGHAYDLTMGARTECRSVSLADVDDPLPPSVSDGGTSNPAIRHRRLLDPQVLADPDRRVAVEHAATLGTQHRLLGNLPTPMTVTDDAALVRVRPGGDGEAVVVRSPALVASLATLFDLLWERATPLGSPVNAAADAPPPVQLQILQLAAMGLKDEAIARSLGRSSRWVRRHVERLEERLGATNRLTLGIAAARRGWV